MQLLLIRHAIAEDKEAFARTGKLDTERPITDEGRKKMERAARGLPGLAEKIDLLATSPLVRARQTADLVSQAYGDIKIATWPELASGIPAPDVLPRLREVRDLSVVALVGHEPGLC